MSPQFSLEADRYFLAARGFVIAAHAILKSEQRKNFDNDIRFMIPTAMLLGHAIECYLKTWLAYQGFDKETLSKRPFGHNLMAIFQAAQDKSLPEPPMPPQHTFLDLVESFHSDHSDYSFRYFREGEYVIAEMSATFFVLNALDRSIGSAIYEQTFRQMKWEVGPEDNFRTGQPNSDPSAIPG